MFGFIFFIFIGKFILFVECLSILISSESPGNASNGIFLSS